MSWMLVIYSLFVWCKFVDCVYNMDKFDYFWFLVVVIFKVIMDN